MRLCCRTATLATGVGQVGVGKDRAKWKSRPLCVRVWPREGASRIPHRR